METVSSVDKVELSYLYAHILALSGDKQIFQREKAGVI